MDSNRLDSASGKWMYFNMGPTPDIHDMLRNARETAGMTQLEVAKCLGLHYQHVSHYENGRETIPERRLGVLTNIFPKLNMIGLQEAWAWDVNPINLNEETAARQFSYLLAKRVGAMVVLTGNKADFPSGAILDVLRRFLRQKQNTLTVITPSLDKENLQNASPARQKLAERLVGSNSPDTSRLAFYFPSNATGQNTLVGDRIQKLITFLHPILSTIFFKPIDAGRPCCGIVHLRSTHKTTHRKGGVWMRASTEFLGDLLNLAALTFWAKDRDQILSEWPMRQTRDCDYT
jgi:transcriptional regulator with XRE-family HTH domain